MNSMIDFENIEYLKTGNHKQKLAYNVLNQYAILLELKEFNPILVGTIPINIDIESSDFDIICNFDNESHFKRTIIEHFGAFEKFTVWNNTKVHAIVASFKIEGFEIEVFGQNNPTKKQNAYRHMLIEHRLILERGEAFRQQIVELKRKGYKTETAFAMALGLKGDPYEELLTLE